MNTDKRPGSTAAEAAQIAAADRRREATHEPAIDRVLALTQARGESYGSFLTNHRRIAAGFSEIFGVEVTPLQAILAMDWVKSCRLIATPDHQDSIDDKLGYMHGYDEALHSVEDR